MVHFRIDKMIIIDLDESIFKIVGGVIDNKNESGVAVSCKRA